jgi:hypothetical protein
VSTPVNTSIETLGMLGANLVAVTVFSVSLKMQVRSIGKALKEHIKQNKEELLVVKQRVGLANGHSENHFALQHDLDKLERRLDKLEDS